jgi:hypothetical protein
MLSCGSPGLEKIYLVKFSVARGVRQRGLAVGNGLLCGCWREADGRPFAPAVPQVGENVRRDDLLNKSPERRLNLSRSWHKGHSHTYNTSFFI